MSFQICVTHPLLKDISEQPIILSLPHLQTLEPTQYFYYQNQNLLFVPAVFEEPHTLLNGDSTILKQPLHLLVPINPSHICIAIYQTKMQNVKLFDSTHLKIFEKTFESENEILALLQDQVKRLSETIENTRMFRQVSNEPSFVLRWELSSDVDEKRKKICFALETLYDYLSPVIFTNLCKKMNIIPFSDEDVQRLLLSAEKRNISNVQILLNEENKGLPGIKRLKVASRPKGINDISSFFKKI